MSAPDPRLSVLAQVSVRRSDPTAEIGLVLLTLIVSSCVALWAVVQLGFVPLTGVLVACSLMVAACGAEMLRSRSQRAGASLEDPVATMLSAQRAELKRQIDVWLRPTSWLISGAGSFLVVAAGLVVLPMLTPVQAVFGGAFLGSILLASALYLVWGLVVRVPEIRRDLRDLDSSSAQGS